MGDQTIDDGAGMTSADERRPGAEGENPYDSNGQDHRHSAGGRRLVLFAWQIDFEREINPKRLAELLQSFGTVGTGDSDRLDGCSRRDPADPEFPLDLAAGATFGPVLGTTYAVIGAAIGAITSFLIGRALGREGISRLLRVDAVFCEKCSDHHVGFLIFLARLIPLFSFDVVSYGAGFTTRFSADDSLATVAGMIPPTLTFTYLGSSVVSAQWLLIGSGGLLTVFFLFGRNGSGNTGPPWPARQLFGPVPAGMATSRERQSLRRHGASGPAICPACGLPIAPVTASLITVGPGHSVKVLAGL